MLKLVSIVALFVLAAARTDPPDTASLAGRITDEHNVAIPAAAISAHNVFSRHVEAAASDSNGSYEFTNLRQGRYSVFARAKGHGCTWIFNVFLYRGKRTQLDLVLPTSPSRAPSADCTQAEEQQ